MYITHVYIYIYYRTILFIFVKSAECIFPDPSSDGTCVCPHLFRKDLDILGAEAPTDSNDFPGEILE